MSPTCTTRVAGALLIGLALLNPTTSNSEPSPSSRPFAVPTLPLTDEVGFVRIFDGKSLAGWAGDPTYWRVENESIVGQVTPTNILEDHNSFLVWTGRRLRDFELRLEYRISAEGNGGINYRSESLTSPKEAMRGYQYDIDGPNWGGGYGALLKKWGFKVPSPDVPGEVVEAPANLRATGQNYDELGRHVLAFPGQMATVGKGGFSRIEALFGRGDVVGAVEKQGWNEVRIIARGNQLIHILNGRIMSIVIDDDPAERHDEGMIGLQIHMGPPMKVEYRNVRLKVSQ